MSACYFAVQVVGGEGLSGICQVTRELFINGWYRTRYLLSKALGELP